MGRWGVVVVGMLFAACSGEVVGGLGTGVDSDGGQSAGDAASASDGGSGRTDGGTVRSDGGTVGDDGGACAAVEQCGNGVDDDCNGEADDGCACEASTSQPCHDGDRSFAGVGACRFGEQLCEGIPGSEFPSWSSCEGDTFPVEEVCEGTADEDCDGTIDEGCGCPTGDTRSCYTGPGATQSVGMCANGIQTCLDMGGTSDWGPCQGEVTPGPELCDGLDYDCDGSANTGCGCVLGTSRACYTGPRRTSGVGICRDGAQSCVPGAGGVGAMWGPCTGEVLPEPDTCDGVDHTCTGVPGAGCACILGATRPCFGGPAGTRGVGVCRDGTNTCVAASSGPEWSGVCSGERAPTTETCGDGADEDCDGAVDEGCTGAIMCPGSMSVNAGDGIVLTVGGTGVISYSWQIISAPTGGAATARWSPIVPTGATATFTPFIVGTYRVRVTGMDMSGATFSCEFDVTALPHGLRVQLTWDGAADLDLHLHNQNTAAPWFRTPDDCYYGNRVSSWGAVLDFDNTSRDGPENIELDAPAIGVDYTIAVHNYSGGNNRIATVEVFCGSTMTTVPTQTLTSGRLRGTSLGNCSTNDFWRVATVRFTSPSACTITPIDTYNPSSAACTAF